MSNFKNLEVYNKALDFVQRTYNPCAHFPKDEQFALTNQFKKAATSICLNIAEGSGRYHKKDFRQFLRISLGSSLECASLLDIAVKLGFISQTGYSSTEKQCSEISKMLSGLINSLN